MAVSFLLRITPATEFDGSATSASTPFNRPQRVSTSSDLLIGDAPLPSGNRIHQNTKAAFYPQVPLT